MADKRVVRGHWFARANTRPGVHRSETSPQLPPEAPSLSWRRLSVFVFPWGTSPRGRPRPSPDTACGHPGLPHPNEWPARPLFPQKVTFEVPGVGGRSAISNNTLHRSRASERRSCWWTSLRRGASPAQGPGGDDALGPVRPWVCSLFPSPFPLFSPLPATAGT